MRWLESITNSTGKNMSKLWEIVGLPRWHSGEILACQNRRCKFDPWVRKIPWRRKWQPTPILLTGEAHGQKSLAVYSPWGSKSLTDSATKQ